MKKKKAAIYIRNGGYPDDQTVLVGESLVKRWKIPVNQSLTLRFGSLKSDIRVVSSSAKTSALRFSQTMADSLGLHNEAQLSLHYKASSRTLSIGPLIGVLVSRVYPHNSDRPFGTNTAFCRELTQACEALGAYTYFFTPDSLAAPFHSITGWRYTTRWNQHTFPLPDVVYNRLNSRKLENSSRVQQFFREMKIRNQTSVFNEKYLNKSEVFQALKNEGALRSYLPESHPLRNFDMLKSMCSRHATVFLKPITGSLGKGIIRISRLPSQGYQCLYNNPNGVRKQTFDSLSKAFATFSGKVKHRSYQIQQGLRLIESAGRPIDFRVLVQRGRTGEWSVTSAVARIAAPSHFVSNIARGGLLSRVPAAIAKSNLAANARAGLSGKLYRAAIELAEGLTRQLPNHFAELGIDLAVETNGKISLLEINSKPSKEDNTSIDNGKIRPSVRKAVLYSQYLAKF